MIETRKVQLTGGSTFIVSLPKPWVTEKELRPGDPVVLSIQTDGSILVSPEREFEKKAAIKEFDISEEDPTELIRTLIGTYMAGYSKIRLESRGEMKPELRSAIIKFTRMVIGPEIIEEANDRIILKDLIDPSEFSQRKGLRRMYLIVKKMHQDAVKSFQDDDGELARDVIARDGDCDRLFWMITKHYNMLLANPRLAESLRISRERSLSYMLVSRTMERIGDHAARIAENALMLTDEFDGELKEGIRKESELALEILEEASNSFFKEDIKKANHSIEMNKELEGMNDNLMRSIKEENRENLAPLSYILESISRTGSYAADISEISIN
ncbi:MAG: phosphate uptake regulator PhoU, partial [Thermoplasmata archaeon]